MRNCGKYLLVVLAALLFAAGTWAQESQTGSIMGRVVDQNGAALPGVTVEISSPNMQGTKVATTDANGRFQLTLLPPGDYLAKLTLEGFSAVEQSGITVNVAATVTLNVQMRNAFREEVTVTGSLIPRPTLEAMSPVATMDVEELAYQGTTRLEDMLTSLPQIFHAQNSTISNGATGTATIDLRYLGSVRTLVLIDGKRAPAGDAGSVSPDLNFIPAALVKRVDVLTGGASATYGADAVAGVVNFILDRDFEGMKAGISGGGYEHNNNDKSAQALDAAAGFKYPSGQAWDGGNLDAYAAWGGKFADGKGHATMYLDYRKTAADLKARRDYLNCSVLGLDPSGPYCGGSSTVPGGRFRVYDPNTLRKIGDYTVDPTTGDTLMNFAGSPLFNYAPYNYMQRPDERWAGGGFLNYEWNKHAQAYVDVMLMNDTSDAQIAPSGSFGYNGTQKYHLNCDNPMLSADELSKLCAAPDDHNQALLLVQRRSIESGGRDDLLTHTSFRLVGGVKGEINKEWSYDAYGLDAETRVPQTYLHDFSTAKIQEALLVTGTPGDPSTWRCTNFSNDPACVPYDIFKKGAVTQAALNFVQIPLLSESDLKTRVLSGKLVGDLKDYGLVFPGASEGVAVALGAEYRTEYLNYQPDQAYIDGIGAGQGGKLLPVSGSYDVQEGFVEGTVPILQGLRGAKDLALDLGYRYSRYNINGGYNTWKAEATWAPMDDFKFRGGYNRATRAPNISELYSPAAVVISPNLTIDPCAGPVDNNGLVNGYTYAQCHNSGVSQAQFGHIDPNNANQYNGNLGGYAGLTPEVADTKTIGIVITPTSMSGFTAAFDYYDIKVKNVITTLPGNNILTQCLTTGDPTMCGYIHRDDLGSLWSPTGYVQQLNGNFGQFVVKGVDANITYTVPVGKSVVSFNLVGSYMDQWVNSNQFFSYDCVGYFGNTCGDPSPKWRHLFRATWDAGTFTVSLAWRYLGAVTVDEANPSPALRVPEDDAAWKANGSYHYPAYNWIDLAATYKFSHAIQFMIGVNNIADKEPPLGVGFSPNDYGPGFHGAYDPYGRYIHSSLQFSF